MTAEKPDISNFERIIARLEEAIAEYEKDRTKTIVRDGHIQRFEFNYEIAYKTLKRFLEFASPSPEQYDKMIFQDLIRSGNEQSLLLGDWTDWKQYRDIRSRTSHAYDEEIALEVLVGIPAFLKKARHLRNKLKERLA